MRSELEDFGTGWVGIFFALKMAEIDSLITSLQMLKAGEIGHFHFYKTECPQKTGIADVEFSVQGPEQSDNMAVG